MHCLHITMVCIFSFLFQKDEISSCEGRVKKLLELTPPKGREFLHKIEHILEREKNWVSIFLKFFLPMFSCMCNLSIRVCLPFSGTWSHSIHFRCGGSVMAAYHMKNNQWRRKQYKMGPRSGMLVILQIFVV